MTGFTVGDDAAVNEGDTVMNAIGKLQAQVTTAKNDAAGGGDFLADGTVNMEGNLNLGGNSITNVDTITTTMLDSQGLFTSNGLWGSNVSVPNFQFEMENAASGLTEVAEELSRFQGDQT